MPSGRKDMGKEGIATRFGQPGGNDNTKGGRNPSIRNQLKELLKKKGELLIDKKDVKQINEDGSVLIKLPTEMQLALKLNNWAMSNKGVDSIKALQMLVEQIDGKPDQSINLQGEQMVTISFADPINNKDE